MPELVARVNEANPDPRVACAILLDTSGSMSGKPIEELNRGYETLCRALKDDPLAQKRTEIMVITFGGSAQVEVRFTEGRDTAPRRFRASGDTPMGAALDLALNEIAAQKQAYKRAGLEYFRPWLFIITDGAPTDGRTFERAADRVRKTEAARGVTVFGIGVGPSADLTKLAKLSERQPLRLTGLNFSELFEWLSASMSVVSRSVPSTGDPGRTEATEQNPLPPATWATWD